VTQIPPEIAELLSECRTAITEQWAEDHPQTVALVGRLDDVLGPIAGQASNPDEWLKRLLNAFREGDKAKAWEASEELGDLLARGLMPEQPRYEEWRREVANGDTRLGYKEWISK
jgi:hypothetical protein